VRGDQRVQKEQEVQEDSKEVQDLQENQDSLGNLAIQVPQDHQGKAWTTMTRILFYHLQLQDHLAHLV